MNRKLIAAVLTLALAAPAAFAHEMQAAAGSTALMDLLEGKAAVAVVTEDLQEAIASARLLAFAEHGMLLSVPATLKAHQVSGDDLVLATIGEPDGNVMQVMAQLRSAEGRQSLKTGL